MIPLQDRIYALVAPMQAIRDAIAADPEVLREVGTADVDRTMAALLDAELRAHQRAGAEAVG